MYRCSVELSVRYDGQSESEHANLIDEPLVYYRGKQVRFVFLNTISEHWICSSGSTDKHTRSVPFGNAARLNLQFDMLYIYIYIFERWICPSDSNNEHSPMELSLRYM